MIKIIVGDKVRWVSSVDKRHKFGEIITVIGSSSCSFPQYEGYLQTITLVGSTCSYEYPSESLFQLVVDEPEEVGVKSDSDKLDWSLIPFDQLEETVRVLEFGANKYSRDNWKKIEGGRERYFAAAMRHLLASQKEELDLESGLNHISHCLCCLLFYNYFSEKDNK